MAKFIFLLICGLMPSLLASKCGVNKIQTQIGISVYKYSANLLEKIALEYNNHFVTSTLSSWTLLAFLSLGATDKTLAQIQKVLQLQRLECLDDKYIKLANGLKSINNSDVTLESSSFVLASDEIKILKNFKTKLAEVGSSQFKTFSILSYDGRETAAQLVNNLTSEATHGTINNIVSPDDLKDILLTMIDTIYFKGSWGIPFSKNKTEVSPFYNEEGEKIGHVNLMYLFGEFNCKLMSKIKAKVLELPYGNTKKYSMLIFLPYEELSNVIENLKNFTLKAIYSSFKKVGEHEVEIQIPRFEIASTLNLKEMLENMDLFSIFDSSAQFQSISHHPLYVTNFIQKATIQVTEEGTVASAVTKADLGYREYPEEFVANRPFLFMIVDRKIKVPIFSGVYSKPSLY